MTKNEYSKTEFPTIDHVEDEIADQDIGHQEDFKYDGKQYHASVQHDGTYLEYGIQGVEVIITEIKD
jgi:hypothetical protein